MHYTVELLLSGDPAVVEYYRLARQRWTEIWGRPESKDRIRLATLLSSEQKWFEDHCGSCRIGQEIMVVSGIGLLYSTQAGFDGNADRARFLHDAFQLSFCSLEVKGLASRVARSYGLLEERAA
jgi:hypothetical protein